MDTFNDGCQLYNWAFRLDSEHLMQQKIAVHLGSGMIQQIEGYQKFVLVLAHADFASVKS
jgi:hypothetical protein